jgi:hypothetical protein
MCRRPCARPDTPVALAWLLLLCLLLGFSKRGNVHQKKGECRPVRRRRRGNPPLPGAWGCPPNLPRAGEPACRRQGGKACPPQAGTALMLRRERRRHPSRTTPLTTSCDETQTAKRASPVGQDARSTGWRVSPRWLSVALSMGKGRCHQCTERVQAIDLPRWRLYNLRRLTCETMQDIPLSKALEPGACESSGFRPFMTSRGKRWLVA